MIKKIFLAFLFLPIYAAYSQNDTCYSNIQLGISYPPVSNSQHMDTTEAYFNNVGIGLMRFDESWAWRESTPGSYDWSTIQSRMDWVVQNHYKLMLTIVPKGPEWACDPDVQNSYACLIQDTLAFKTYLDSLFTRYVQNIDKVQFGNEPLSDDFWPGNIMDFVTLNNIVYRKLKEISPNMPFVLSGFSTGALTRYAACNTAKFFPFYYSGWIHNQSSEDSLCGESWVYGEGQKLEYVLQNANYDKIDLHLYADFSIWGYIVNIIKNLYPNVPFVVSEFGGPHSYAETNAANEDYQADMVFNYIKTLDSLDINQPNKTDVYFFKLIERGNDGTAHGYSGLLKADSITMQLVRKPSYFVFEAFEPCSVTSTDDISIDSQFINVYPNPAKGSLTVQKDKNIYNF